MTKLLITALICVLAAGPVFPLTVADVLTAVPDESFAYTADVPVTDVINTEPRALLSRSYAEERASAGAAAVSAAFPVILKTSRPEPAGDPAGEIIIIPQAALLEIPYISAGSDGCGIAGEPVFLGAETPAPAGASFEWEQLSGPAAAIDNALAFSTFFITDEAGVCTFLLQAEFADGRTGFDTAVFIVDAPGINNVPTVNAGEDLFVELGSELYIRLQAAAIDADDDPLTFAWRQVSGPDAVLYFSDTDRCEFLPAAEGVYTFEVTVSDGQTESLPDSVSVICCFPGNLPPVAAAESLNIIFPPEGCVIQLDGSSSYDPEQGSLLFAWEQTDGPPVQLSSDQVEKPYFMCETEGDYWFELKVNDGQYESIPLPVSVHAAPVDEEETGGCAHSRSSAANVIVILLLLAAITCTRRVGRAAAQQ